MSNQSVLHYADQGILIWHKQIVSGLMNVMYHCTKTSPRAIRITMFEQQAKYKGIFTWKASHPWTLTRTRNEAPLLCWIDKWWFIDKHAQSRTHRVINYGNNQRKYRNYLGNTSKSIQFLYFTKKNSESYDFLYFLRILWILWFCIIFFIFVALENFPNVDVKHHPSGQNPSSRQDHCYQR